MKNKKKLLLIAAILILAIVSIGTYAIYKSTATGTSGFKTAKWYIELNGEDITTSNTFTFDLKQADWTHNAVIDSDETELVVIAPGSYGTFGIELDASETEVDVVYTLTARVLQNDTEVELSTINPNLSIGFYENDTLVDNPLTGSIAAHGTYNGEIRIVWDGVDSSSSNSQDININDQDFVIEVTVTTSQKPLHMPVCIPATALHTNTCERGSCVKTIGSGNAITYGTLVNGTPKSGDAYDCDVNDNGVIDTDENGNSIERFYYVSDYYDVNTDSFDSSKVTLIYYTDMSTNGQLVYSEYDSAGANYKGPRAAYSYLPNTSEWKHPGIIVPGTRQIRNESGGTTTTLGTIVNFSYEEKAARLLTTQELVEGCPNISVIGSYTTGELDNCNYLMETVGMYEISSRSAFGYWLETPKYESTGTSYVWDIYGADRMVIGTSANNPRNVRPAITVLKSDIEQ